MGRVAAITRQISWYWATLMGDNHYRRYVEHRGRLHPDEPVISEREYWRMRHDAMHRQPRNSRERRLHIRNLLARHAV